MWWKSNILVRNKALNTGNVVTIQFSHRLRTSHYSSELSSVCQE